MGVLKKQEDNEKEKERVRKEGLREVFKKKLRRLYFAQTPDRYGKQQDRSAGKKFKKIGARPVWNTSRPVRRTKF